MTKAPQSKSEAVALPDSELKALGPGAIVGLPDSVEPRRSLIPDLDTSAMDQAFAHNCSNCKGWRPMPSDRTIGMCLPSAKALPAPLITTDRGLCSKWVSA